MTKPETEKLPELPECAASYAEGCNYDLEQGTHLYTADQMRAYALAALRAQGGGATPDAAPDADGERYRWLRAKGDSVYIEWGGEHANSAHGDELDAAIDAAIAHARSAGEKS